MPALTVRKTAWLPRVVRWTASGLLLALLPKCLACVVGYLALAGGLGLAGRELCGPTGLDVIQVLRAGARFGLTPGGTLQMLMAVALVVTVPLWLAVERVLGVIGFLLRRVSGKKDPVR